MPRPLNEIIAHIRMVIANPQVSTTLVQTEDLQVLCDAASLSEGRAAVLDETQKHIRELKNRDRHQPEEHLLGFLMRVRDCLEAPQ